MAGSCGSFVAASRFGSQRGYPDVPWAQVQNSGGRAACAAVSRPLDSREQLLNLNDLGASCLDLPSVLPSTTLRFYAPYFVPAHVRDDRYPDRHAWVHPVSLAARVGDGWLTGVSKTASDLREFERQVAHLPEGVFVLFNPKTSSEMLAESIRIVRSKFQRVRLLLVGGSFQLEDEELAADGVVRLASQHQGDGRAEDAT